MFGLFLLFLSLMQKSSIWNSAPHVVYPGHSLLLSVKCSENPALRGKYSEWTPPPCKYQAKFNNHERNPRQSPTYSPNCRAKPWKKVYSPTAGEIEWKGGETLRFAPGVPKRGGGVKWLVHKRLTLRETTCSSKNSWRCSNKLLYCGCILRKSNTQKHT